MKFITFLSIATLIRSDIVIPAKAGIQKKPRSPLSPIKASNPGFPRINYGAGLVKPGMVNFIRVMSSCIMMIILLYGCNYSYTVGGKNVGPPKVFYKGPVPVKVFFKRPVNIKYVEVGTVTAMVGSPEYNWVQQIEEMQKQAASKGANGIIIVQQERDQENPMAQRELTGMAIKITDMFYLIKSWFSSRI